MTDIKDKILAAIDACFAASPAPPTSGDLAAAVLREAAEDNCCWFDTDLHNLADQLDGAMLSSPVVTDADLEAAFRAWWAESYPTPPGPHALMTHLGWARHLLKQAGQQQQEQER